MGIANREISTAEAANMVLGKLAVAIRDKTASNRALPNALFPVFGIRCSVGVVRRAGGRRINGILVPLRSSNLASYNYNRFADLWEEAFFNDCTTFPNDWGDWRSIIERFDLDDAAPIRDWIHPANW